jgi:hypothetical protein
LDDSIELGPEGCQLVWAHRREEEDAAFGCVDPRQVLDSYAASPRFEVRDSTQAPAAAHQYLLNTFGPDRPTSESLALSLSRLIGDYGREQSRHVVGCSLALAQPSVDRDAGRSVGPVRRIVGGGPSRNRAAIVPAGGYIDCDACMTVAAVLESRFARPPAQLLDKRVDLLLDRRLGASGRGQGNERRDPDEDEEACSPQS